jgi:hypothetical protein
LVWQTEPESHSKEKEGRKKEIVLEKQVINEVIMSKIKLNEVVVI